MGVPIWTSDEYKAAKIEEMNRNREEQSLRMELMRCQLEESSEPTQRRSAPNSTGRPDWQSKTLTTS
jgi:hypothetical protein